MTGRKGQIVERCVEYYAPRKVSYVVDHDSFGFSRMFSDLGYSMILEPEGTDKSVARLEYYYHEKSFNSRFVNWLMIKPKWNRLCREMLSGLKRLAEETSYKLNQR